MSTVASDFYVIGGTLRRDAPSYVKRRADDDLYDGLSARQFCYVLTSRQMGKSSLMVRTAVRLRADGISVAVLDLTAIGQNVTAEQWYEGLLGSIGQQLDLEDELEDFWLENKRVGPLQRWMRAIREVVLPNKQGRLAIFVDEIDAVRSLPFSTDEFFAGIREFYNRRTEDTELERLTFCLLGVATPSDLIRDTRTTPFNIGRRIELTDFAETEAAPLGQGLGREEKVGGVLLQRILYWTGGHPYLTQRLCQSVASDETVTNPTGVDRLCEEIFLSSRARERDDNLLFVRERMLRSEEADRASLLDLYQQVRKQKRISDDETNTLIGVLRLAGITRALEGYLFVRNRIYYRVFDQHWVIANMPDAELRRQRAAYRKGILRTAAVAVLILGVMGVLAVAAVQQRNRAEQTAGKLQSTLEDLKRALKEAETLKENAQTQSQLANERKQEAEQQRSEAEKQRLVAEDKTQQSIKQEEIAKKQQQIAEQRRAEAERLRIDAQRAFEQREIANKKQSEAEEHAATAEQEGLRILRLLYAGQMNQAQQAWQENKIGLVRKLQDKINSEKSTERIRGFEWDYLWRLSHAELSSVPINQDGNTYLAALSGDRNRIAVVGGKPSDSDAGRVTRYTMTVLDVKSEKVIATFDLGADTAGVKNHVSARKGIKSVEIYSSITAIALSPDGMTLVTGHDDDTLRWWNVSTQKEQTASAKYNHRVAKSPVVNPDLTQVGENRITSLEFSPDGKTLASGSTTNKVALWDVPSRKQFRVELSMPESTEAELGIGALSFSPDMKLLAASDNDRAVRVWKIDNDGTRYSLTELLTFKGHEGPVTALAFSIDSKILATGGGDSDVKLWNMTNGGKKIGSSYSGHDDAITGISFAPDGQTFATASKDETVRLWKVPVDLPDARLKPEPEGINGPVAQKGSWIQNASYTVTSPVIGNRSLLQFSLPVKSVGSSPMPGIESDDFVVARGPRPIVILRGHQDSILSVTFSSDSKTVITAGADDTVKTWSVSTQQGWTNLGTYDGTIYALAYSPDGKTIATGASPPSKNQDSSQSTLNLWDVTTGKLVVALQEGGLVNSVAFSPDGKVLASGGIGGLKLWDVVKGEELNALDQSTIFSVTFSPDGKLLVAGNREGAVTVWGVATKQKLMNLQGHVDGVEAIVFTPDSKMIATASHDHTVRLWDMSTGQELAVLRGHSKDVKAAAFSPDGSILATGSSDNTVKLWNVVTREEIATLEGHGKPILFAAFSPDGMRLATAGADNTVKLWDVASRQEVASLKGHTAAVWAVVFSPDGKTIATGSEDQTVKLWRSTVSLHKP